MSKPKAQHRIAPEDYERARELWPEMTFPEKLLWHKLRQFPKEWNLSFRRQQPIPPYTVDFVCMKLKLVIELDGMSHDNSQEKDEARTNYLKSFGYTVIRFTNNDVQTNPDGVTATILARARTLSEEKAKNTQQATN